MTEIQHNEKDQNGTFFIQHNSLIKGELVYTLEENNIMRINHTEVDDELQGKNKGKELLEQAVAYARDNHLKIVPACPFVRSVFERDPDRYKDVWQQ